ncbi:hypothetical protein WICMUC_005350 [Wickerhamomyces mucosus]|uniref:Uncharacterized protein n=1 Tax=Wickerhamomyces mucosus TaxID=1378264 RepID=A0A9P8P7J5_9ASCO|nr:hypothetical protein WICMUC_005350 [Wickerhamomyces mucosus]
MTDYDVDFLERVKQLDLQRQQKETSKLSKYAISIPYPVSREDDGKEQDQLIYGSAYNYEQSQKHGFPSHKYHDIEKNQLPEIIRFDDHANNFNERYKQKTDSRKIGQINRYTLSDREREEIDAKLKNLIYKGDEQDFAPQPLIKEKKGGSFIDKPQTPSKPAHLKYLPLNSQGASNFSDKKVSENGNQKFSREPNFSGPIKEVNTNQNLKSVTNDANPLHRSKKTFGNPITVNKDHSQDPKFLNSVIIHSKSSTQGLSTSSNFFTNGSNKNWFDSAIDHSSFQKQSTSTLTKIKPIVSPKSNSLDKFVEQKYDNSQTLKELNSKKLSHITSTEKSSTFKEISDTELEIKKSPPKIPQKSNQVRKVSNGLNTLKSNLKPTISTPLSASAAGVTTLRSKPTITSKPKTLPEGLTQTLRKSTKVGYHEEEEPKEALLQINKLRQSKPVSKRVPSIPEYLLKKQEISSKTPVKPIEKPSKAKIEALEKLNSLKKSRVEQKRVHSNSKEILESSLNRLKSIKELEKGTKSQKDETKNILENLMLRKIKTEPLSIPEPTDATNKINRSQTFDSSQFAIDKELTHLTKTRAKGPRRRAPKN